MGFCSSCGNAIADDAAHCSACGAKTQVGVGLTVEAKTTSSEARGKQMDIPRYIWVMGGAALLVFISTLMPWASLGFISINGTSTGDGKLAIVLAVVGLLLAIVALTGKLRRTVSAIGALLAILAGFTCAYDASHRYSGSGEWVGLLASIVWAVAAISGIRRAQAKEQSASVTPADSDSN